MLTSQLIIILDNAWPTQGFEFKTFGKLWNKTYHTDIKTIVNKNLTKPNLT